jgi:hypothetical protein
VLSALASVERTYSAKSPPKGGLFGVMAFEKYFFEGEIHRDTE